MGFLDYFAAIVTIVALIIGAWAATRFVSRSSLSASLGGTGNIKIIDRYALSKDQMLLLVSIQDEVYFLGVTTESINVLDRRPPEGLCFPAERSGTAALGGAFKEILERCKKDRGSSEDK